MKVVSGARRRWSPPACVGARNSANRSSEAVRDIVRDLLKQKLSESAPEHYAITVGLVSIYVRPFTNNKPVGKLSDRIVPAYFKDFHESILIVRNRLFAHADVSATIGKDYPIEVVIENDGKEIRILTTGGGQAKSDRQLGPSRWPSH
jgi:hypothetical protein